MVHKSKETFERDDIQTILDSYRILWLNQKHMEEGFDHKHLCEITIKYHSNHRKHRYELVTKPKKQCNVIFKDDKLAIKLIMGCRTTSFHKFRSILGFKLYDVILTKEQSVPTRILSSFEEENMQALYVLGYRIDLYFHDYNLTIEIDENGHSKRNMDYETKR